MDDDSSSSKKAEVNRRNALKSTGPKTNQGKRKSRWNALRHGLLAKEVVIRSGERKENPAEFKAVLAELGKSLEPRGVLEEMLVEGIAICYWRWRRALRCEAAEITAAPNDSPNGKKRSVLEKLFADKEYGLMDSERVQERINALERVRQEVEKDGIFSDYSKEQLRNWFGPETDFFDCMRVYNDTARISKERIQEPHHAQRFEGCKKRLLTRIMHEREVLEEVKREVQPKDEFERKTKSATLDLPSDKASEKIIRYETTLERRMRRAIENLERLQSRRKREPERSP